MFPSVVKIYVYMYTMYTIHVCQGSFHVSDMISHHPASLPYSSVTLLVSHAPLNYLGFFEPYVAFVFVIFIQGGLKTGKKKSGGL